MQREVINKINEDAEERIQKEITRGTRKLRKLEHQVAKFEKTTGLKFDHYDGPPTRIIKVAQRLVELESYGDDCLLSKLTRLAGQLESASKITREAIDEFGSERQSQNTADFTSNKNRLFDNLTINTTGVIS